MNKRCFSAAAICALLTVGSASAVRADELRLVGAGSLTQALTAVLARFPAGSDRIAEPRFGPSGLMREQISNGLPADVFASADMGHARALATERGNRPVVNFVRNRLCAMARPNVGLTSENMLDTLLQQRIRLGTSTPGADPGGDYAFAMFKRADAARPGAGDILAAKALKLVGGGEKTPPFVKGKGAVEGVFLADKADVMLGYCSSARLVRKDVPDLDIVQLPPALGVKADYGAVVLSDKPVAARFAAFLMSETAQGVLREFGFEPVAFSDSAAATSSSLTVSDAAGRVAILDRDALAKLPSVDTSFAAHDGPAALYSGPSLWDVLVASGLVPPDARQMLTRTVRVSAQDGYHVVFGLGELAPDFGARSVIFALRRDGAAFGAEVGRLVIPSEKRAGRSVRDVVHIRID